MLMAIVLGAIVGNVCRWPARLNPGVRVSALTVLKCGVALLGLSISVDAIMNLGWKVLLTIVGTIVTGFLVTIMFGKLLKLSDSQALLIGAGCSICGAAALGATYGVVRHKNEHEFLAAIAIVTAFGTAMIVVGPAIVHSWQPAAAGVFIGAATHEVSQVVAAGGIVGATALPVAVATKLGRVLLLAPTAMILSILERNRTSDSEDTHLPPLIPSFIIVFIILVIVRSLVNVPPFVLHTTDVMRTIFFATAMFAQGLAVTWGNIKQAGTRTFLLGFLVSFAVGLVSLVGALSI